MPLFVYSKATMLHQHSLKYILLTFNIIIHITAKIRWKHEPMHWYENPNIKDEDLCADRVVCINLDLSSTTLRNESEDTENHTVITTGVMISNQLVLTSYNAFRKLARERDKMKSIVVGVLIRRIYEGSNITYEVEYAQIVCGRQVLPMRNIDMKGDDWHGNDYLHSPVHDLMVLRLEKNLTFQDENNQLNIMTESGKLAGPLLTILAKSDQALGRDIQIASIGHETDNHIYKNFELLRHDYDPEDNVVVDCDQWIPRQWGHFICLRNVNDFEAIGSGAVLFYNGTLFGIGSFALRKGRKGILVFTDVRPYNGLINETCTAADQI